MQWIKQCLIMGFLGMHGVWLSAQAASPSCTEAIANAGADDIIFAHTMDGKPISYTEFIQGRPTKNVKGVCGDLFEQLHTEGYPVVACTVEFYERFEKLGELLQGRLGVQCGTDSKTRDREDKLQRMRENGIGSAKFTRVFAETSTKLLIRRDKIPLLYTNPEALRIGVLVPPEKIGESNKPDNAPQVTSALIQEVFAMAKTVPLNTRTQAINLLRLSADNNDAIDAYAGDAIVLEDMLSNDIANIGTQQFPPSLKLLYNQAL